MRKRQSLTMNNVQPKIILSTLKDKRENNLTNTKQIYNTRQLYKKTIKGSRT